MLNSQIWLNLPKDNSLFFQIFQVPIDDRHLGYIKKNSSKKHRRIHIQFGVEIWNETWLFSTQPNSVWIVHLQWGCGTIEHYSVMPAAVMLQWKNSIWFLPEHSMFRHQPQLPTSKPYSQLHLHVWDTLLPELKSVATKCEQHPTRRDYCSNKIKVLEV